MKSYLFHILAISVLIFSVTNSQGTLIKNNGHSVSHVLALTNGVHRVLFTEKGVDLSSWGITTDYYGNPRSNPSTVGAFEYSSRPHAFYVSNTASGSSTGRSWTNAWNPSAGWDSSASNPNGINWSILGPGDTLYISGGSTTKDYTSSAYFLPRANGSYANYLVITKGQDAGHNGTPILNMIGTIKNSSGTIIYSGSSDGQPRNTESLVNNHHIEFNGFQVTYYIAHQDEQHTNNFVPNGYHLRFKNITCSNVTTGKFFDFTGHPRYVEFINCYLRQASNSGEQTDLIWVRGDASYAGGGLYADSIFIINCTLISNNQDASPHSDGFQYVDAANVWTEGCKFYGANNKPEFTQQWYGNGYTGKVWFLNNTFYVSSPAYSPMFYLNVPYVVNGVLDSIYWVDNTMVADLGSNKNPYFRDDNGGNFDYVWKNNIMVGAGNMSTVGWLTDPASFNTSHNIWYNPGQSTVTNYNGSARAFSYMDGLAGGTDENVQPTFTNFNYGYSKTLATYEAYNFNVVTPLTGTAFKTSFGGHTYTSDGKIGSNILSTPEPTEISDTLNPIVIKDFSLHQNYPNPFNPKTTIEYSVQNPTKVTIKLFDVLGKEMQTLLDEEKPAGVYYFILNAGSLPSGVYFYRIQADSFVETKKMILMK